MVKLIFLGTGAAAPEREHENTHMALVGEERLALIDCVGSPILRMQELGIDLPQRMTDLLLTHFHPDHVSGLPMLVMGAWLLGRKNGLPVRGLGYTVERAETMMSLFEMDKWPNFYPVTFHPVPEEELALVLECPEFRILGSPVCHLLPTMGLRFELAQSGKTIAYSCDTSPCDAVVRLAREADILVHEASGRGQGHSSASQAGEIATRAGAKSLYLIHYPGGQESGRILEEARSTFNGPVYLTKDCMELVF